MHVSASRTKEGERDHQYVRTTTRPVIDISHVTNLKSLPPFLYSCITTVSPPLPVFIILFLSLRHANLLTFFGWYQISLHVYLHLYPRHLVKRDQVSFVYIPMPILSGCLVFSLAGFSHSTLTRTYPSGLSRHASQPIGLIAVFDGRFMPSVYAKENPASFCSQLN